MATMLKASADAVYFFDAVTGEMTNRPMNEEELAQRQADLNELNTSQLARDEKEAARAALLDRLGITADEAKLLAG